MMSSLLDETAADVPVKDVTIQRPRLSPVARDFAGHRHAWAPQDISHVSREELEDRFLRLREETLQLKQHIHKQDEKIRKLSTKLIRLVKDRERLQQLAAGKVQPPNRFRDAEAEEMIEELQENVRGLQAEKEVLKQRLLVAKNQVINSQRWRPTPYGRVQPRVDSGLAKFRDDASSVSRARPRSLRNWEAGRRPPTGQLPRYGHSLLEEARAEIRNLKNLIDSQQGQIMELEGASEELREELKMKEAEYEEHLQQMRQQHTSSLRTEVTSNVSLIKLQKQLADRSNVVTMLEGRFVNLQEAQQTLTTCLNETMVQVDELKAQLKEERLKSLELEKRLQSANITTTQREELQERIHELEQERDLLKEENKRLLHSAFDVSQQQKWQLQEQQLKLQISQLETALKADLVDKNEILDKMKAERDRNEQLAEENRRVHLQILEQKQQMEELNSRLKFCSRENEYNEAELTEALLLIKTRKSQKSGDLGFLAEEEESDNKETSIRALRAAHAETFQELEKTRKLLSMESRICGDYKAELEAVMEKAKKDRADYEQKLKQQTQLLDARATKIHKLEAKIKDVAYSTKAVTTRAEPADAGEAPEASGGTSCENVVEFQIIGVSLSPTALQTLGDAELSTFCTYSFYRFKLHATPVVTGFNPKYNFTSTFELSMDQHLLDYLDNSSVTVELHQTLHLDWKTLGRGEIRLQDLLGSEGSVRGSVLLFGTKGAQCLGSLEYSMRLKTPVTKTKGPFPEIAASSAHSQLLPSVTDCWNQLFVTIRRCSDLRSTHSQLPSPYVVYKFYSFPDHSSATVHDCRDPEFNDVKSYSVSMDSDLDRYLRSEELQISVFDFKEEWMETFVGKAAVSLLPLVNDQNFSGVFELLDSSGRPAGHIEVLLKWKLTYVPPPGSVTASNSRSIPERRRPDEPANLTPEPPTENKERTDRKQNTHQTGSETTAVEVAPSKPTKQKTQKEVRAFAKRVKFVESTDAEEQIRDGSPGNATEEEEESHLSEGQLIASAQSCSDDSDISDEIPEDAVKAPAAADVQRESPQSDSDDCIVQDLTTQKKLLPRIRVEIVSLSLQPRSRLAQDDSVVRLFVEYSFLDLPTEETPLSLPKPPPGRSINYNYSKVILVDTQSNAARRRLLKQVLQGRNPQMERIRFTVVSEPPEEEEQEKECEDVGVAFLRIPEILEKQQELMEVDLDVLDVEDNEEVLGHLTVSVEGLEALRAIMEDKD
ncbi:protein fantom [Oryzias melastigma]|uniref:RPGRIP1 like n=1 Tax=Oryzias melastigma TaxID=30732 RepID=A0A3B3CAJ4_ORYME|nr:protein fantom [Oryzias melastigma]XP_024136741.1 protein fantom [Oryzias melastigma]